MMSDQNGILITKKEASVCAATLVVLGLLIFIGGYFYGKQSVIDGFTQKATQESFNDKVDYLLTMQSFAEKNGGVEVLDGQATPIATQAANTEMEVPALLQDFSSDVNEISSKENKNSRKNKQELKSEPKSEKKHNHYAVLSGFSKRANAAALVARLKTQNIDVEVKKKTSKSASGKVTRTLFQVITKSYDSRNDVQNIVDKVLSIEKIKRSDIKII
jgi:cell division septation protein DedD